MSFKSNTKRKGFTLMESVIAIGVVAILLTTFLAIFGPATQGIRRAISSEDADRLITSLEKELSILRETEARSVANPGGDYISAFDKAYNWIKDSSSQNGSGIVLLNYRSDVTDISTGDGKPAPVTGDLANSNYVVTATAELLKGGASADLSKKLPAVVGPIVFVKTRQLVYNNQGELELGQEGNIKPPREGQEELTGSVDSDKYPEATIAYNAEFYLLPTNSAQFLNSINYADLGKPLFTRNLAVRR